MLEGSLTNQGLLLMLYGMGTVVVFLLLLVLAINMMSRLCGRYFPEQEYATADVAPINSDGAHDDELLAVIGAAVHRFRSRS